jgi:NADH-quinone oxidoreductase subunit M
MIAFAVKIPLFPFHMWLPDAYEKAPAGVTFALSAIASKVAIYAILRFTLPLFPADFVSLSYIFVYLGLFGMLYFAIVAISQTDIKRTLAYSSASHLGLITAGIFGLNMQSMVGGIYQLIAHAMSTGVLFLLVAKIGRDLKTRDINSLGGLAKNAPIFATFFAVATFSTVGLPGTNGFIGEFLIILGTFKYGLIEGIVASSSVIVGAIYMFIMYRKVVLQKLNPVTEKFQDLNRSQIIAFFPVIALIFIMGIYPKPFLKRIEPTIDKQYREYIIPHLEKK